jgi:hypothetical protein
MARANKPPASGIDNSVITLMAPADAVGVERAHLFGV